MKKILILGASVLQLPTILKAKEMGLYVGVIDYDSDAVGVKYADQFFNVSTVDEKGVLEVAQRFCPNGILTVATDMPMRSVAYASSKLGLPSIDYEAAIRCTDKGKMIQAFESQEVSHPWYELHQEEYNIDETKQKIVYPCICKPVDSSGSRGVILIQSELELNPSIEYAMSYSKSKTVILEEYVIGSEVSVEILIQDGCYYVLNITDKLTTGAPYFVEVGHSQPSRLEEGTKALIEDLAIKAVKALEINVGAAHVEMIISEDGPKIIEVGARLGGDCITSHLIPLSTGIDMVKMVILIALGEKISIDKIENGASAIRYLESKEGKIEEVMGVEEAQNSLGVQEVKILKVLGENTNKTNSSTERLGYVIAKGSNAEEAIHNCEVALSKIRVKWGK